MKFYIAAIVAIAGASPVAAQSSATTLSVNGRGGWEMICHLDARTGPEVVILSAERSVLVRSDLQKTSCDSSSGASGPLVVKVTGQGAVCPFKDSAPGSCERSFKSGSGSFTIKTK